MAVIIPVNPRPTMAIVGSSPVPSRCEVSGKSGGTSVMRVSFLRRAGDRSATAIFYGQFSTKIIENDREVASGFATSPVHGRIATTSHNRRDAYAIPERR